VVEVVEDVASDAVYGQGGGGGAAEMAIQRHDGTSQLTLSFRGQVYVFDSVTPDKVSFFCFFFSVLGELSGLGFLSVSFDGCLDAQKISEENELLKVWIYSVWGMRTKIYTQLSLIRFQFHNVQLKIKRCFTFVSL
jgi:hypothetical protein